MRFSTHYYVLSLSTTTNTLFEAFRHTLIEVANQGFPVSAAPGGPGGMSQEQRCDLGRTVDRNFRHYYVTEPLRLVVVGSSEMKDAFASVTDHGQAVIGWIEGDHAGTSPRDLGQIVWPVVREAMSGVLDQALSDLEACTQRGHLSSGLEAVVQTAGQEIRSTLMVDDDYQQRGSISRTMGRHVLTPEVDVRDVFDDVVDAVIETVLQCGGNVVFTPPGTLRDRGHIVLLRHGVPT